MLRPGQLLFTYLHLAPDPEQTSGLCGSGATCIAYETVEDAHGRLPLLAPMSEIAGKIATQAGAFMLEKPLGGRGILLGGVPGVAAANVMVIGGGVVGMNAAFIAIGMEADVFVFDRSIDRLRELDVTFGGRCSTVYSTTLAVEEMLPRADLVIGAVLVHGARAPYVVQPRAAGADEARARSWSTSRSTRAAASRPRGRPPIASPPSRSTGSPTTASPTCPARSRSPPPTPSPTRPCPTRSRSPTTASPGRSSATPACAPASTSPPARSRIRRWPRG